MKLADWAKKQGISYLTAYRWFKAGRLPVPAYQSDSGTIIVQEGDEPEKDMSEEKRDDSVVSEFLKKTVEFSKNGAPIEDFAAFVLTNYKLEQPLTKSASAGVRKAAPTKEMINEHFKQFLKPAGEKPKPEMFIPDSETQKLIDEMAAAEEVKDKMAFFEATGKLVENNTLSVDPIADSISVTGASAISQTSNEMLSSPIAMSMNSNLKAQKAVESLIGSSNIGLGTANNPLNLNFLGGLNTTTSPVPKTPTSQSVENGSVITRPLTDDPMEVVPPKTYNFYREDGSPVEYQGPFPKAADQQPEGLVSYGEEEEAPSLKRGVRVRRASSSTEEVTEEKKVTYDDARKIVDLMVSQGHLTNDPITVDRQAKEICKVSKDTYEIMLKAVASSKSKKKAK